MPTATLSPTAAPTELAHNSTFYPMPMGAKSTGVSFYDYVAIVAMQGFMNHGMKVQGDRAMSEEDRDNEIAQRAYKMADAMLRTRAEAAKSRESNPSS